MGRNKRWLIVLVLYIAGVIVVMNQYQVPPLMAELMQTFQVSAAQSGWFMSVFAFTGILLALPSALLLKRFGPKVSGAAGLVCVIIGCAVGWMATTGSLLLLGRTIEGIGLSMIAVIAPAVITMYFSPQEIGLPMGIWATWYAVGSSLAYNISQPATAMFGSWRGNWVVGGILAVVILIIFVLVIDRPKEFALEREQPDVQPKDASLAAGLKVKNIWLLGASFLFMMMGAIGFLTWAPTYFATAFGLPRATANMYASIGFLWNVPGGLFCGWIMGRTSKKYVLVVLCAVFSLIYAGGFLISADILIPFLSIAGFVTGFACAIALSMVPFVVINAATPPGRN